MTSLHVVIRGCGERTLELSRVLVEEQLPPGCSVSLVSGVPFEATLTKCYQSGIAANKDWTVTVDADVLLAKRAVAKLVEAANEMPGNYVQLEAQVFDKLLGQYRKVGHRVYRTELLPELLEMVPEPGKQVRPESWAIKQVVQRGHPYRHVSNVVGLHDFEQSYVDLYRKAFTHAHKHQWLITPLVKRCAANLGKDADFLVILKGLWDGLLDSEPVAIDRQKFSDSAVAALETLGIAEKPELSQSGFREGGDVDTRLLEIAGLVGGPDTAVQDFPQVHNPKANSWLLEARKRVEDRGWMRGGIAVLGAALRAAGSRLDR